MERSVQVTGGRRGIELRGPGDRVVLGPALPAVLLAGRGRRWWRPDHLDPAPDGDGWVCGGGPEGLILEVRTPPATRASERSVTVEVRVRNEGAAPVALERVVVLASSNLKVGEDPRRWRTYRNGYQSWAGTRTLGTGDADAEVPTRIARLSVTDLRHRSPKRTGVVRSDAVSAVVEPVSGDALALALTAEPLAFGFVELAAPQGVVEELAVWADLDGVEVEPGVPTPWFGVRATTRHGPSAGWDALRAVLADVGEDHSARGTARAHPAGWCSWYYYFAKVTQADVEENLAVLARDGRDGPAFRCEYVMVDDGHQSAIGDWLETDRTSFPDGMEVLAGRIRDAGFDAGIWWAPFLVDPRSRVAAEHPEWLVRNRSGRPIVGILNPVWSATRPMRVLDTTNPEVLDHVERVAATIGSEWGYSIQKLDFLYAAALPGVRHDARATRAQSLRRGLDAVRAGAGEEAFLLGCGCPLGPAVGVVDAMRIGADVTPYWSNPIDRVGGRGWHGLSTRHAVVNTCTRAVFDGLWWLNDPDCLMVRDTDTKLGEEEVRLLATAIGMTDGMVVISDRLPRLSEGSREVISATFTLSGGRVEVADLFERSRPELLVTRHPAGVDVGVLNMSDRERHVVVDLARRGVDVEDGVVDELWTGAAVPVRSGLADLGSMPAHSARVLKVRR